ncbi:MAG: hypothetical protein LWW85_11260, partial [Marinilabiliales bacterium]|nr:hypothetical protein [Marinilabiliales bacterium]
MNESEIKILHRTICSLLSERKLKPAFDKLEKLILANGLGELQDQLSNLEQNYRFMLQYTVEGINDPERQKIYQHILLSAFELADSCTDDLMMKYSGSLEYQKKRGIVRIAPDNIHESFAALESFHLGNELKSLVESTPVFKGNEPDANRHFQKLLNLFYHYWFRNKLSADELSALGNFMSHPHVPDHEKAFLVTAVTLSLLSYFDEQKIVLLFNAYDLPQEEINQRALTGLLLALYHYDERSFLMPSIAARLVLLGEENRFRKNLEQVLLQLIGSKETEKIQKKLAEEIIPEMMKLSPNLRNKLSMESLFGDFHTEDKNPDWQDILKEAPGFMDKIEELNEMQMKGADIFMTSFSSLKSFPFFSELGNWFVPYFSTHPQLAGTVPEEELEDNFKIFDLMMKTPVLCNSDKYSFCFSMQTIPAEYKKVMFDSMTDQFNQLLESEEEEEIFAKDKKAEAVSGQYIRDLYRFFKLHPQREGFEDPFAWSFDFHNKQIFRKLLLEDFLLLRNIAEYYFAKNYYQEAA